MKDIDVTFACLHFDLPESSFPAKIPETGLSASRFKINQLRLFVIRLDVKS
jgi:hypothetical protein